MSERETVAAGAQSIRQGSKSFAAAARLFDRGTREGAVLLYGWCRHCDDVVDGQRLGFRTANGKDEAEEAAAAARLARLERETRRALAGEAAQDPVFAGLALVARRHAIPDRLPLEHLQGFAMDVEGRRYETLDDTLAYAHHVAGVVGIMMGHVMGVRDAPTLGRARDLGLAFQLTNIARDVVEDAEAGRVYLPAVWLRDAGIPPDEVAEARHRKSLAQVAARLVAAAEPYYESAGIGIRALPPRCAWAIAAARGIYRDIGREVVRRGPRAWDGRVSTSGARKLRHVVMAAQSLLPFGTRRPANGAQGPRG